MQRNIYLIGFMGCGKTTVGGQLAIYQGKKFLDLDSLIIKEAHASIPQIFRNHGEIGRASCRERVYVLV